MPEHRSIHGRLAGFQQQVRERFPALARLKRQLSARWYAMRPLQKSYGEHGEDAEIRRLLSDYDLDSGIYLDIGANHPVTHSNTYLFYRLGLHGISVEPIADLVALHHAVRPRDIVLAAACDERPGVAEFTIHRTPTKSSLVMFEANVLRQELVPVVTVDSVFEASHADWTFLLNVDVEGRDLGVLQGAVKTLPDTLLVCVEANTEADAAAIRGFLLPRQFEEVGHVAQNLLFRSLSGRFEVHRRS